MHFKHKKYLIALMGGFLFSLTMNVQAQLTIIDGGLGVYDSGLNATWTQDANLLGTLENTQGYNTIVNAVIVASNGVIYDTPNVYDTVPNSGAYTLTAADFGSGGTVDWWAAQAYVHYLDSINYGDSTQWVLPITVESPGAYYYQPPPSDSQLAELYYIELGVSAASYTPSGPFSNVQSYGVYWSSTVPLGPWGVPNPSYALIFDPYIGYQYYRSVIKNV